MSSDSEPRAAMPADVPLIPAGAIGFLLYPSAVQLVLANPPANDTETPSGRR